MQQRGTEAATKFGLTVGVTDFSLATGAIRNLIKASRLGMVALADLDRPVALHALDRGTGAEHGDRTSTCAGALPEQVGGAHTEQHLHERSIAAEMAAFFMGNADALGRAEITHHDDLIVV